MSLKERAVSLEKEFKIAVSSDKVREFYRQAKISKKVVTKSAPLLEPMNEKRVREG